MEGVSEEMTTVGQWASLAQADEHALVVLAMRHECRVRPVDGAFALEVEPAIEPEVRHELELYATEQVPLAEPDDTSSVTMKPVLALPWILTLIWVFRLQQKQAGWDERYLNSSYGLFAEGEWWRPFTSLFLHADLAHLTGNIVLGGFFCVVVLGIFGGIRGWLLILFSGVMGNVLTCWFHWPEAFRSLGASTATFGALGILVGSTVREAFETHQWRSLWSLMAPLGAGATVLTWWGTAGTNTDVVGHMMGWSSGLFLGLIVSQRGRQESKVAA